MFEKLFDPNRGALAAVSTQLLGARSRIVELEQRLAAVVRRAQWVADLAYNKGVADATDVVEKTPDAGVFEALRGLRREPRHAAEFGSAGRVRSKVVEGGAR